MSQPLALIVDDEPDICELLEITLQRMDIATRAATDLAGARQLLGEQQFDICLTDMRLPDGNGIDLVRHIQTSHPSTPTAVITAHGNMETAVEALKAGAFDFVSKPVDLSMLRSLVNTALRLTEQLPPQQLTLIGSSPAMAQIRQFIAKVARSQAPVFINGESGTGKELVARMIHEQGPRASEPFVPVNCGAIPGELMESEFFGHKKGSFTGAYSDKEGLFAAADGGTLFLDEVADLPLPMQVKLLRAIQEKRIKPVGSPTEVKVDVRILSASHKDLAQLVDEEKFRKDLFYRINVIGLHIPPLRDRAEDIPELTQNILARVSIEQRRELSISDGALKALTSLPLAGNVRELENMLERAVALCDSSQITSEDLELNREDTPEALIEADLTPSMEIELTENLSAYLEEVERETILKALKANRWNRTATAKQLGITFRALRYRLKKLGID